MTTIANLSALRARKNERARQAALGGFMVDPMISIELKDLETVISLMERIDIHRGNLRHLLNQRGHFGASVPAHIVNQIISEREQILTLRLQCARLGHPVDTHEVDNDEVADMPQTTPAPLPADPLIEIRDRLRRIEEMLTRVLSQ